MKDDAVPSLDLRIIEGGIPDHHPIRNGSHGGIRNRCQADTCRRTDLPGLDRKGMSFDTIPQPFSESASLLPICMGQQDRECIPSVPPDDIAVAYRRPYQIGGALEHTITGRVTETVVYGLEEIQVQQQQAGRYAVTKPDAQFTRRRAIERLCVEHLCDRITKSEVPRSLMRLDMA
jgi:hypothetical protein